MRYIIDAHAWIEYLEGGEIGEKVHDILKSDNEKLVLPITIAEVVSKVKRKKNNFELAYESIISNARVIDPTPRMAKAAGFLHAEEIKKQSSFGIVDALIISVARLTNSIIVTGDRHFRNFKNVKMLD
jgi:predicted nucleic acid-binding protein